MKTTLIFTLGVLLTTNALAMQQPDEDSSEDGHILIHRDRYPKQDVKEKAERGDFIAQFYLGCYYHEKMEHKKVLRWWIPVAKQGSAEAQRLVGKIYWFNSFDKERPDYLEARKWFKLAAAQGDLYAQAMLQ